MVAIRRYARLLTKFYYRLTEPAPSIQERDDRHQSQMFAALLVLSIPLVILASVVSRMFNPSVLIWQDLNFLLGIITAISLMIAYFINRSGRYKGAAIFTVGAISVFVFIAAIPASGVSEVNLLFYLILPVLLGGIFLSTRDTVILIGIHAIGMLLFPLFTPKVNLSDIIIFPIGLELLLSSLVCTAIHYRNSLEFERKTSLVESEERYRAIVQDQTEFICRSRPDGTLTFVNEPYCRHLGKTYEELIKHSFAMFIPEEERAAVEEKMFSCSPDVPVITYEHRVLIPDGEARWHHWTSRAIFDHKGRLIEFQSVGRDITERKEAEERLQESKNNLEKTLSTLDNKLTELKALHHIAASMTSRLEIKALLQFIVERARLLVDSSSCSVLLRDEETDELIFDAAVDPIAGMRIPPDHGIAARALRERAPQIIHDVRTDEDHYNQIARRTNLPVRSLLVVPLFVRDKGIGTLNAINKHHGYFDESDSDLLMTMGIHAAIAIENARLYEQAQQKIIERKQAENALRESHRFLQSTLDALSAHITILDDSGVIVAINASWRHFADANHLRWADYGIGRNYLEICASAFGEKADGAWEAATGIREVIMHQRKEFTMEYPCHSPTRKRWFMMRVTRFKGEGPVRVVVSHEDVTARKQAEVKLRESEELFRQLADNLPGVVWLNDPGMTHTYYISPGIQDLYGVTPEEECEHPGTCINSIHPDDREKVMPIIEQQKRGQATSVEYRVVQPDDSVRWVLDRAYPIRDENGEVYRVVAIAIDITARKRVEEMLQKQTTALNERVKELRCLYSIYKLLERRDAPLNTLFQNIVDLIPLGWQYPDATCARILLDDQEFKTSNFAETDWSLSSDIAIGNEKLGSVEVYYLEEKPRSDDDSLFYSEEEDLLDAIAERVSEVIRRKRAEDALRESEQRYSSMINEVLDNATVGIFILDADFKVVWVNRAIERFFNLHRESIIGGDNRQVVRDHLQNVFEDSAEFTQRVLATYEDNSYIEYFQCHVLPLNKRVERWLEHLSQPIMTGLYTGGRIEFYTDVTARKHVEEALRESEEKWRSLAENAPDTIFTVDREGKITFINRVPPGLTAEEALGTSLYDYIAPEYVETVRRSVEGVFRTGKSNYYEISARGPYDEYSWYSTRLGPIKRDDEVVSVILITRDITERKRAEELLQEREQKFHSVIEKSGDGIVLTNEQGIITEWNQAAARIFGLKQAEVVGRPIWEVQYQLTTAKEEVTLRQLKAAYDKLYESGQSPWLEALQESEFVHSDGTHHSVQTSYFVVKTNRGFMVGSISRDITEQKEAEQALEEERASLALRVYERTAELSRANAELARAARLKDEFLANMSHELRTPLNAIIGLTEALQEQVYGELNEKQLKSARTILESGNHLLALINDILDVSKIEAGKLELELDAVYVRDVCRASLGLIRQTAHKKHLQTDFELDDAVKVIRADGRRLKQILVNLLSNAVKFTPDKGHIGLEVVGDAEQQVIHFTVWDTGIGIPQDKMERLFRPFVQLDSTLSRRYSGTGLGLVLVQRLADMHGGSVSVESEVGEGSRFTVSLPWKTTEGPPWLVAGDSGEGGAAETSSIKITSEAIILLVEDNESNIDVISRYLRTKGYRINIAESGAEAILNIWEERPDVILMDIQMPDMDGLEATRCIRADVNLAEIPIIAMTALAMPGDREQCLKAGANDYISKPVSLKKLVEMIEAQLHQDFEDDDGGKNGKEK